MKAAFELVAELAAALLTQQWLWGALVAGGIAYAIQRLNFKHSVGEQRRVATMQIASQIRTWLIGTSRVFQEQSIRHQPDPNTDPNDPSGYFFPEPSDIPAFPFADALERISSLHSDDAQSLFNLIEQRWSAENEAELTWYTSDKEDAATVFEPLIAQVYLDCSDVYSKLAKQVGWVTVVVPERELADMRKIAARAHETRELRADLGLDIPEESNQ